MGHWLILSLPTDSFHSTVALTSCSQPCRVDQLLSDLDTAPLFASLRLPCSQPDGEGYYAVLRGRQPGVYNTRHSAEAQVRGLSNAYQRAFDSEEAEEWLLQVSGCRYTYYEAFNSITRSHSIEPRCGAPADDAVYLLLSDGASRGNPGPSGSGGCVLHRDQARSQRTNVA